MSSFNEHPGSDVGGAEKAPPQILRDAAELIRRDGLCKGSYSDIAGRRCAIGALMAASGTGQKPYMCARTALGTFLGNHSISAWNDEPERTADEVISALESAAASLEGSAA